MNQSVQQGLFYDDSARSPGSQRQSGQPRQPSGPFEGYSRGGTMGGGNLGGGTYFGDEQDARFQLGRNGLERLNTQLPEIGGYNLYDPVAAQTWNANAFSNNAFGQGGLGAGARTARPVGGRGRNNLPSGWMDQPMNMGGMASFGNMPPPSMDTRGMRSDGYSTEDNDELIPTAIVIKNIPFAVRKEELVEVMTNLNLPLPYAFNYHFDNGVFRGLAFANFTSAEETGIVIDALNHFELNGRKLRVEYKKMLPLQERERIEREKRERRGQLEEQHRPLGGPSLHNPPSMSSLTSSHLAATSPSPIDTRNIKPDLNDPQTLGFYNEMLIFKSDMGRDMLIFPSTLSAMQRRVVHTLAHTMGLSHSSRGSGEQRQVYVSRTPLASTGVSPPLSQAAMLQPDMQRRTLNRSATTDFSEHRGLQDPNPMLSTLRGQHSTGFLGPPESPGGFGQSSNLRAAKSFADLRSFTPSPVPSTASFPTGFQTNMPRMGNGSGPTPTLTPTASNNPLGGPGGDILAGLGSMSLGGGSLGPGGSPRRLRGMFSWDREQLQSQSNPSPAPIGSNRNFSMNSYPDNGRIPGSQTLPIRQPRGPAIDRAPGFARSRQNGGMGHQQRGSDELSQHSQHQDSRQQGGNNVEIIVEH